jgi:glucose/arabinose dehydrogenase
MCCPPVYRTNTSDLHQLNLQEKIINKSRLMGTVSASAVTFVLSASLLNAEIITKTFSLTADTGPFSGTTGSGTFTYDDANIFQDSISNGGFSPGGYSITRAEGLTIDFTVFGQTYTEDDERGVGILDATAPVIHFNSSHDVLGIDFAVSEIAVEENGLSSTVVDIEEAGVNGFEFISDLALQQDGSYIGRMVVELSADPERFPWELFLPAIQHGSTAVEPRAVTLNTTLTAPWGLAFLPDARMLVTQKEGSMVILSADGRDVLAVVSGLPSVLAVGQGGLLDVALDPDFDSDPWVYWTYAEAGTGDETGLAGTAVARGRLTGNTLQDVNIIYRQVPKVTGNGHYGSRLAFNVDKTLFVTLGERQKGSPAQDLATTLGKVIRVNRDGTIPADNPVIPGARPEIWSYGHRNPQGAAIRQDGNALWLHEHGPQGGDEINHVKAGGNYGWPLVSYGCNYGDPIGEACQIGGGTHAPTYIEPVSYWVPTSIAPAGMIFYSGTAFPQWQGDIFMGALAGKALWRVKLEGNTEVERESLFPELGERVRDVEQGPDGWIYLLTDSGKLIQIRN